MAAPTILAARIVNAPVDIYRIPPMPNATNTIRCLGLLVQGYQNREKEREDSNS
ncbi:hypothetical protein BRCON_2154 [Candidatus Sumerlaea chitinivorans]|uniref:Uncharacterized protein n=1 Tax=Sumerlaea chitinivorans TaxID=2250252 RepID=A0A2Z4Y6X2_SUMC1|nr:hypothetical protein BRCON_2154 [Candidatus Sumerlaea chitinivorans]